MEEWVKQTWHRLNTKPTSHWVLGFIFTWSGGWLLVNILLYMLVSNEEQHAFLKLSPASVKHQKSCMENFLAVFNHNRVPVLLWDAEILEELFQLKPRSWHDADHECKTMCKHHPEEKNLLAFAVRGIHFYEKEDRIVESLRGRGFETHLTLARDPRVETVGVTNMIPAHLWLARQDHIIHVAFLHERVGKFLWAGGVSRTNWRDTLGHLEPALTPGWHDPKKLGIRVQSYEQAFDVSHNLLGLPLEVDGHEVMIPYNIKGFLHEQQNARFLECNRERAAKFRQQYPVTLGDQDKLFMRNAKKLILRAKQVLDGLSVPFWLSSGTCLGWFRQCDVIPYTQDVDFGIFIRDYNPRITAEMERVGLMLTHSFGRVNDSFELSFEGEEQIKLDLFFFYEDEGDELVWNGGTEAHNGQKYKYHFAPFDLCWTEFLEAKLRVPCQTLEYVRANYGDDWFHPTEDWVWYESPPNVEKNGVWPREQWDEVIQLYRYDDDGEGEG